MTNSKLTFAAARSQAEKEVLTALNIPTVVYASFDTLDVSGDTDADHVLEAISALFVYNNASGPLSALIADFQADIGANGKLTVAAIRNTLAAAAQAVNPAVVAANLTQKYTSLGVTFTAANISDWIDQNGDGVVGAFKFQVADATPSSVFTFPTLVVQQIVGTSVAVTGGQLSVNGTAITGAVAINSSDVVTVSPGAGSFPNGVLTIYLMSGQTRIARVSFVSGLVSIAVTPASPNVPKGLTQQFKAMGSFSDTSTADITSSVGWASSVPTIATIGASTGLAQTVAVGSTMITASSGSVSASSTLSVTAAALESISITPNPAFAGVGISMQLNAVGTYSDASTANITGIGSWTSKDLSIATVGQATGLATGVMLGNTTISVADGSITAAVPLSITANTWHPAASLISGQRCTGTATLLLNGKVLLAGGFDCHIVTKRSTVLYDPAANTWSQAGALITGRAYHTATLLPNGKVLVTGGESQPDEVFVAVLLASAELYDPATDTWASVPSMSVTRKNHTATLLPNGKVLVAGGFTGTGPAATAEIYDPASDSWSPAASMSTSRGGQSAVWLPNVAKVLVIGGSSATAATPTAELYDPMANAWSPAGSMSSARYGSTTTLLSNGVVVVAGGSDTTGISAAVDLYDSQMNTWSLGQSLSLARSAHAASLLPSGKLLVSGGQIRGGFTATAELYDPMANAWLPAGSMSTPRSNHSSTVLNSGVVLAISGDAAGLTCELYW